MLKDQERFSQSDSKPSIDVSTPLNRIFNNNALDTECAFSKAGDEFYIYFQYQFSGRRVVWLVYEKNSITITLDNDEQITLYPTGTYSSKNKGYSLATAYVLVGVFYKISKEQLEQLASNRIKGMEYNYYMDKKIKGAIKNNDKTYRLDMKIPNSKVVDEFKANANCILEHK